MAFETSQIVSTGLNQMHYHYGSNTKRRAAREFTVPDVNVGRARAGEIAISADEAATSIGPAVRRCTKGLLDASVSGAEGIQGPPENVFPRLRDSILSPVGNHAT